MERDRPWEPDRTRTGLILLGLALAAAVVLYAPTLGGGFLADDYWLIDQAQTVSVTAHPFEAMRKGNFYYLRPLQSLWWSALYRSFGLRAPLYRASSLMLHLLAVISVFVLAKRAFKSGAAAGLGSIVFAVHPLHAEAVCWVSADADLFAAFFFCLALERWLAWREGPKGIGTKRAALAAFGLASLALLSKESAYVLAPVMIAAELLPGAERTRKERAAAIAMAAGLTGLVFLVKLAVSFGQLRPPTGTTPLSWLPSNAVMALVRFAGPAAFSAAAFPVNLALMAALAAALVLVLTEARSRRGAVFGLALLVLALLPPAGVARIGPHLEFSRTLYLPSIGFALATGALWAGPAGRRRSLARGLMGAAVCGLLFAAASINLRPWVSAGRASVVLEKSLADAAQSLKPGQSALVKGVPVVISGVPFHGNSYTLSVAMAVAGFPKQFKARGYDDRNDLPFYCVSAEVPPIEAMMTHVKRLRQLKGAPASKFDLVMEWDSPWAVPISSGADRKSR